MKRTYTDIDATGYKNPPSCPQGHQSPFAKGGSGYPPLWQRGVRGDSIKGLFLAALFVPLLSACGGGGGGVAPAAPSYTADFTAGTAGATPGVTLQKKSVSGSIVYVDVVASPDVSNLFGADIRISIGDTAVADLGGACTAGSLMPGATVYCSESGGVIELGVSLQSPASPVSGGGVIATVPIKAIGTGTSALAFTASNLYDDNAPTPNALTVNSWTGGTASGV